MADDLMMWPIAIVEDRYGGTYSLGRWLGIACASKPCGEGSTVSRLDYVQSDGPYGGDCEAMMFWSNPPEWIVAADTPNECLAKLRALGRARVEGA